MSNSIQKFIKAHVLAALTIGFLALGVQTATAGTEININDDAAVHGHDVVAYFKDGKAMSGSTEFTAEHEGATYRFSSAENRDMFSKNPAKYAPQYGGYCAFGAAMGRKFDVDPDAWKIVDGKLYLNNSKKVQVRWSQDIPGFIKGADGNWSKIRNVADAQLEATPPAGVTVGAQ